MQQWTLHGVALLVCCLVELEFRMLIFVEKGKAEDQGKNPRTNNKLNPTGPEIELRPQW